MREQDWHVLGVPCAVALFWLVTPNCTSLIILFLFFYINWSNKKKESELTAQLILILRLWCLLLISQHKRQLNSVLSELFPLPPGCFVLMNPNTWFRRTTKKKQQAHTFWCRMHQKSQTVAPKGLRIHQWVHFPFTSFGQFSVHL